MAFFPKVRSFFTLMGVAVCVLGMILGITLVHALLASRAQRDGEVRLAGLKGQVWVERDALGIPTVEGLDRIDIARVLGFVHAQDRFFQMDLMRRAAAGELSSLLGGGALVSVDQRIRLHQFRQRAEAAFRTLPEEQQRLLLAYSEGVNQGLGALGRRPPPYLALVTEPEAWTPIDSLLVGYSMYLVLQDSEGQLDRFRGDAATRLPPEVVDFLFGPAAVWDVVLSEQTPEPAPLPPVESWPKAEAPELSGEGMIFDELLPRGSNAWAVAGSRTSDGHAWVANDMHLGLAVPNLWYRARLIYGNQNNRVDVSGFTLPGLPVVVTGTNGHIAWGFTNAYIDTTDVVQLVPGEAEGSYLRGTLENQTTVIDEVITVRGEPDVPLPITQTSFGPVIGTDAEGNRLALRWIAHVANALNLGLLDLERAQTVEEALTIAADTRMPVQNFVVADTEGSIGWTLIGTLPRRDQAAPASPILSTKPELTFTTIALPEAHPRVINPPEGYIASANQRMWYDPKIGDGGYYRDGRAERIRTVLAANDRINAADLLALQCDEEALIMRYWRDLMVATLERAHTDTRNPSRSALERTVKAWGGTASAESRAYPWIRAFRDSVHRELTRQLLGKSRFQRESQGYSLNYFELPYRTMIDARVPMGELSDDDAWHAFLLSQIDMVLQSRPGKPGEITWGEDNRTEIRHPLTLAMPWLDRWLNMPSHPQGGDIGTVRVARPAFGASQRMVVSPAVPQQGIAHMPGGQSEHPLSPHYRDGHQAWVDAAPTPFLPGPPQHRLKFRP
jgi:penicillin amidase